jgi:predicted ester cyclase
MDGNKSIIQDFQRDIDTGQSVILDQYIGASYADHNPPPFASKTPGIAGLKETFDASLKMFSDFKHVVEDQLTDGDKVVTRITGSGKHIGPFLGIPPTNKMVTMSGIAIHRIAHGRLVEHWGQVDAIGLLTQMGALPAPPAAPLLPNPQLRPSAADSVMDPGRMKAALRRLFEEGINRRNQATFVELIDPAYVNHSLPMPVPGPQGFSHAIDMFYSAFPDMQVVVEDVLAEPDKVASRGYFTGTHKGTFMNVPATGKTVTVAYIDFLKALNGRFIENWVQMDMLGCMMQLGVIPPPA